MIRKQDMKAFYSSVLSKVMPHMQVVTEGVSLSDYQTEPLQMKFYLDIPKDDLLTLRYEGFYGEQEVLLNVPKENSEIIRELPKEQAILQYLMRHMTPTDNPQVFEIQDTEEKIYDFLLGDFSYLETLGEVYITDALKQTKLRPVPKIQIGVSLQGNLLDLKVEGEELSTQELYEILKKYQQKKRYYRMKSGAFFKMDEVDEEQMDTLNQLVTGIGLKEKDFQKKHLRVERYRSFYLDRIMQGAKNLEIQTDQAYRDYLSQASELQETTNIVPAGLKGELRDYQKRGFHWMNVLQKMGLGGILADEMGLGKTIQVITLLLEAKERAQEEKTKLLPSLIVCPASLVYNWLAEIKRFAPGLQAIGIVGDAQKRMELLTQDIAVDVLVTSYDLLRRDMEWYENKQFRFQVIDEAQFIKNQSTKNAQSVKQISAQAKFALTGTPIENRLSELWSIFDYLMPGYMFSYAQFKRDLETPIVREDDEAAHKRLQHMIAPFVLRRRKKDVLSELPEKLERVVFAELEGEQKKLYAATRARLLGQLEETSDEDYRTSKIQILAELTKLRQICCAPGLLYENYTGNNAKLETCMELVGEAVAAGHKILLFSQFTSMLEMIQERLTSEGITYITLTGETSKERRQELVAEFQAEDSEISVFLISLKAGGTGLNLTAADVVIHYDPWWNVAAQNQATDRTHRIGQTNVVSVHKLIMDGSIEEKILELQDAKYKLAEDVLSGEHAALGSLSKEALMNLLQ